MGAVGRNLASIGGDELDVEGDAGAAPVDQSCGKDRAEGA